MVTVAKAYLADAELLESSLARQSDGAYLLRLTALEILLKATLRSHGDVQPHSHRFADLFAKLPEGIRHPVLERARSRFGPKADLSQPTELLEQLGHSFVDLRYSYERYEGLSGEEYRALGSAWAESGAHLESAAFRYHPLELEALTYALDLELFPVSELGESAPSGGAA